MSASSASLLLAAVMVGFAAAWLVLEVRRAWSPESVRGADRDPAEGAASEDLTRLVQEVTLLRREIAAVRAAEIEAALRNRQRELQLTATLEAAATRLTPRTEPSDQDDTADDGFAEPAVANEAPTDEARSDDIVTDDIVPHSRVATGGRS